MGQKRLQRRILTLRSRLSLRRLQQLTQCRHLVKQANSGSHLHSSMKSMTKTLKMLISFFIRHLNFNLSNSMSSQTSTAPGQRCTSDTGTMRPHCWSLSMLAAAIDHLEKRARILLIPLAFTPISRSGPSMWTSLRISVTLRTLREHTSECWT